MEILWIIDKKKLDNNQSKEALFQAVLHFKQFIKTLFKV